MRLHLHCSAVADAVNEVKCKAIVEIQKVIAESEAKTERLVAAERARLEVAVASARQQAIDEILQSMKNQHDSAEVSELKVTYQYL